MEYIAFIIAVIIGVYMAAKGVIKFLYTRIFQKKCAWCSLKKIKYITTKDLGGVWMYKNKDGTKDKRRKNTWVDFGKAKHFRCLDCNAVTSFRYYKSLSFDRRTLVEDGSGIRIGKDWKALNFSLLTLLEHLGSVAAFIIGLAVLAVGGIFIFAVVRDIFF